MAESLRTKAVKGAGFLAFRQVFINLVNFLGNIALARILMPEDFGLYSLVMFLITFFSMIGDGGLGAYIIRKPNKISGKVLSSIFTFQQGVMLVISLLLFSATFFIGPLLKNSASIWVFRVSILSYFLLSFRSVPVMLLDREMSFKRVAALEIAEAVAFQAVAVTLAFTGAGVWALICGMLAKNIAMAITLIFVSTWRIKYGLDMRIIKAILPFSLSFQGSHFVNLIKDSTVPVWMGATLGMAQLGFITWASTLATYPLLASNMLARVFFPFFSRLQKEREKLKKAIELVLRVNVLAIMAVASVLLGLAEPITKMIYTEKWLPALPLFMIMVAVNYMLGTTTPLVSAFNARGKSFYTFLLSVSWAVLLWVFALILVPKYRLAGYGIACLLTYLVNIKVMLDARREFSISVFRNILPPLLYFAVTAAALYFLQKSLPAANIFVLILYAGAGACFYAGIAMAVNGKRYMEDIKMALRKNI